MYGLKRHRSYITKEGYMQRYNPRSPEARSNGYVAVHRDVASRKIGRPLRPYEVVHHRDGDKLNNRPSNLQVVTRKQHWRIHHSK